MTVRDRNVSGAVLIGGRSTRMGTPKATLALDAIPLWQRALDTLIPLCSDVALIGAIPGLTCPNSLQVIPDDPDGEGPLGGIMTALAASLSNSTLVIAVDYPFVQLRLLEALIERCGDSAWAVCGRNGSFLEPLVACYDRRCLDPIRAMFDEGEVRTHRLFDRVPSYVLSDEEYQAVDPGRLSQLNVNTPEDWSRATQMISQIASSGAGSR